ncbi:Acetyltransferase (GNAT) domain-containing protein [Clostridium cavendishii DSM 21758]|uniref:Acetyltransferase (GNAT) domain-containing protein n=1 Tax=Clostridium cavendishii DSM 21758 TaxID=1121302 RepID=A0A1M6JC58_9CLOT|nr:GNAT family N-acetyltransferase [Clostridium cavendishii]SHJ44257.1 Acetyltransferase (GNAT) domain-containing protein [Clostridium cavendishii DSM 21758]
MGKDIYEQCPSYHKNLITLRQTKLEDAEYLLDCYSDKAAVGFFNSDNCHGDDFYYTTIEKMRQAIDFWNFSYENRQFVRWTIILNETYEKIGTVEMFHREVEDEFNHYGILRIDLQSKYEKYEIISEILNIVTEEFYEAFEITNILTKAIKKADQRILALENANYIPLNKKFMIYDDYFVRSK